MKIGIIGAGEIGGTLTRRFTALGHDVSIANSRGPETLAHLTRETGAKAVTVCDAARAGEVIIVTIHEGKIPDLPKNLFAGVPDDVVVVDTGNYYPQRDGRIKNTEDGMIESRWVETQLGRPVVKAFNTMNYKRLLERGCPEGTLGRIALPVAGDDQRAKQFVVRLVDELGFGPVDAGGLDDSWRQQPGKPVYDVDHDAAGVRRTLTEASPERKREWRARNGEQSRQLSSSSLTEGPKVTPLMLKDLEEFPGKEGTMMTVEDPPGGSDPSVHRHNAYVFLYLLEGPVVMQVKGGKEVTLMPGQTFYQGPNHVHVVGRNASSIKPAKFLVFLVKDKGAPLQTPER